MPKEKIFWMTYEKKNLINCEFKINFVKIKMSKEKKRKERPLEIITTRKSPPDTNYQ